jgi:hypothetical protein
MVSTTLPESDPADASAVTLVSCFGIGAAFSVAAKAAAEMNIIMTNSVPAATAFNNRFMVVVLPFWIDLIQA